MPLWKKEKRMFIAAAFVVGVAVGANKDRIVAFVKARFAKKAS